MINYEEFKKVEMRVGKILAAEKIPDTDKLLRLKVDFAEKKEIVSETGEKSLVDSPRQIVSGISMYFPDPEVLVGRTCMFVTNLEPRMIRGFESNGMILALSDESGNFSILEPNNSIKPGTAAK